MGQEVKGVEWKSKFCGIAEGLLKKYFKDGEKVIEIGDVNAKGHC